MILEYAKGELTELSDEFDSVDFDCKCDRLECNKTVIDDRLLRGVTELAHKFPMLYITSGFRCAAHNKEIGGSPKSQHLLGTAADLKCMFATPKDLKDAAEMIHDFANGGIGLYRAWIHCDVRKGKARW